MRQTLVVSVVAAGAFAQLTARVSVDPAGFPLNWSEIAFNHAVSADGRWLAYHSCGNVYLRDLSSGQVILASPTLPGTVPTGYAQYASISDDGRYVAFESNSDALVPGDTNGVNDVFVFDRLTNTVERVSVDSYGNQVWGGGAAAMISGDGSTVAFASWAGNLVPNDTNYAADVFVRDLATGVTTRESVDSNGQQVSLPWYGSNHTIGLLAISRDGMVVAFESEFDALVPGDTNMCWDVFVRDRAAGTTSRVSVSSTGVEGDNLSLFPSLSGNGRHVAFASLASTLVPGDTNGGWGGSAGDVFVHDRWTATTERVNLTMAGTQSTGGIEGGGTAMSCNGRFVAYQSYASDLVPNDTNGAGGVA
ncbi:MAG: hypothetical protein Q8K63_15625, partial [Acidimicrobiales bacterium]|nr:hypothetical protein [Acidimicrobiales bacterium]